MEESAGSPTCLFGVSIVAVVGLFSSFVVFPLLKEGAAEPQGKSPTQQVGLSALGAWKREVDHAGGSGPLGFAPGQNSAGVCDIQGFFRGRE